MTKTVGKQGNSLTPDANGDFYPDELKAMYAHWLKLEDEKGLVPAGVCLYIVAIPILFQPSRTAS